MVSGQTASAAELLISVFKGHTDAVTVRLVGQQTYGKPVGFFPIQIDRYKVYLTSFLIRNAQGWSDYFDGMAVDIAAVPGSGYSIGDERETLLAAALTDIRGTGNTAKAQALSRRSAVEKLIELDEDSATMPKYLFKDDFRLKSGE